MKSIIRAILGALVVGVLVFALPVAGNVASGQTTETDEWPATGAILTEHAQVYSSPDNSKPIGEYINGDNVTIRTLVSDQSGDYYAIDFDGNLGYISTDSVSVINGEPRKAGLYLIGDQELTVGLNTEYSDPGVQAFDEYGNDVSDEVKLYGTVDTSQLKTYHITYEYINYSVSTIDKVIRTVTVVREADPKKVEDFENSENEDQASAGETYTSSTGLVKVHIWTDNMIIDRKLKIYVENTLLGDPFIFTRLPNLNNNFSNSFTYEVINNGEYTFYLNEDSTWTLKYSIMIDAFK